MSSLNTQFRNLLSRSRRCSYMANFGAVPHAFWSENMAEVWEISRSASKAYLVRPLPWKWRSRNFQHPINRPPLPPVQASWRFSTVTIRHRSIVADPTILDTGFQTTLWRWFIIGVMHAVCLHGLQDILIHQLAYCTVCIKKSQGVVGSVGTAIPAGSPSNECVCHCSSNNVSFCYKHVCVLSLHCPWQFGVPDNVLQVLEGALITEWLLIVHPVPYHLCIWKHVCNEVYVDI